MNIAGTISTDDIPPEVLEQMGNPDSGDFGYVGPNQPDVPGVLGFVSDSFDAIFGIAVVLVLVGVIFTAIVWGRNYKASKNAGLDPFTLQTELAVRAANSEMLAPKKTLEQKLAELDSLLARGLITRDEYTQARLKALTD